MSWLPCEHISGRSPPLFLRWSYAISSSARISLSNSCTRRETWKTTIWRRSTWTSRWMYMGKDCSWSRTAVVLLLWLGKMEDKETFDITEVLKKKVIRNLLIQKRKKTEISSHHTIPFFSRRSLIDQERDLLNIRKNCSKKTNFQSL